MNTPTPAPLCPKCDAPLPADAPEGLCPRCLASASLLGETFVTGEAAAPRSSVAIQEIAPHFPQLEILECLGRGGMGIVYKARQKTLNRFVALKLLAPERVHDAAFAERFAREAQALAALSHPGIVTIYDFGEAGRFFYLLMEFVDGVNLRQAMKGGRFTPEEALAIVPPVCEALQYAHEHSIVHRDIKPENLLLDKEGRVKIADFGIAKMLDAESSEVGMAETQPAGTPQYMAPEQKGHRRTDHRADIYSLGVVLYELLTGELPAHKLQPPSRKVQIDVRLDEIVLRALEKTPELRFQTAAEFRTQVETVAGTPEPPAAPPAQPVPEDARISRLAVVGACWAPLFFICIFLWFYSAPAPRGQDGPNAVQKVLVLTLLPLGLLAPFGTTILGWVSVWQIRISRGKLFGLGLAAFDGLFFPLCAMSGLIAWLWWLGLHKIIGELGVPDPEWAERSWTLAMQRHINLHNTSWIVICTMVTGGLASLFMTRRVWWTLQPKRTAHGTPQFRPPNESPTAYVAMACSALAAALGVLTLVATYGNSSPVIYTVLALAAIGWLLAWPVRRVHLGRAALVLASAHLGLWLLIAGGGLVWNAVHPPTYVGFQMTEYERQGRKVQTLLVPPYIAETPLGMVYIRGLTPHPRSNGPGWRADGQPTPEQFPDLGGYQFAAGKVMRELVVWVQNDSPSEPVVRFAPGSGFLGMGTVSQPVLAGPTILSHVVAIACPPDALEMNVEIGVGEGEWQVVSSLPKPTKASALAGEQSSDADGHWDAHVQMTETPSGEIALAWHYSVKPTHETRLVAVDAGGKLRKLEGSNAHGSGGLRHSQVVLSAKDYAMIRGFQFQRRLYQWTEFHHVSLKLGHQTQVETVSAPLRRDRAAMGGTPLPVVDTEAARTRYEVEARLLRAVEAYLTRQNTKEQPGEEIEYSGLNVDLARNLLSAEIIVDQPKPQATSPHAAEWKQVRVARLVASQEQPGEWVIRARNKELGRVQFKVHTAVDTPPAAGAVAAPSFEEKKSAPAVELPPPKISVLDIERHTRNSIEAWDVEGKPLSSKQRWIVQSDVFLEDEVRASQDRVKYLITLFVENPPPDSITHGDWSASFGDGTSAPWLATFRPMSGSGAHYRITTEIAPDRQRLDVRFGIPIRDWAPVLVLEGPAWKAAVRQPPFASADLTDDFSARVSLMGGIVAAGSRLGLAEDKPMTQLQLKMPEGVHYTWDWNVVLVDAKGKEYVRDQMGGHANLTPRAQFERIDPDLLIADFWAADPASIVKIVLKGRSHERDYHWAEFNNLPLASADEKGAPR